MCSKAFREKLKKTDSRDVNVQLHDEIGKRKWTEVELEKSFSLLHATLESIDSGIAAINLEGVLVTFNQKFVDIWQIPDSIITLRDHDRLLNFFKNQLKKPETFDRCDWEICSQSDVKDDDILELKDGRIFERCFNPLRLGERIIGIVWSFRDITTRKRTEEALKQTVLRQWRTIEFQQVKELQSTDTARLHNLRSIFPACPQLNKVFLFIEENYHRPINLSDVAQTVGYSPGYLTSLVKRLTGRTVHCWIIERRIAEACSLLLESDLPVNRVAAQVGYPDSGHFIRQFRQLYQMSPKVWRNKHRYSHSPSKIG